MPESIDTGSPCAIIREMSTPPELSNLSMPWHVLPKESPGLSKSVTWRDFFCSCVSLSSQTSSWNDTRKMVLLSYLEEAKLWHLFERNSEYLMLIDGRAVLDAFMQLSNYGFIPGAKPPRSARKAIKDSEKLKLLKRFQYRCAYCLAPSPEFHFDHIMPVSLGGSSEAHNIVPACPACNFSKGAKTLWQWKQSL